VEQQVVAVSELSQVLIDSFQGEQILSFVIGELSKPTENGHFITEALQHVIEIDKKTTDQPPLQELAVHWIIMCLDNFIQIVAIPGGEKHALFSLTCLLLLACKNSMRTIFLHDLYYTPNIESQIETIFLFAGVEFYVMLETTQQKDFILALSKITKGPYRALLALIEKK